MVRPPFVMVSSRLSGDSPTTEVNALDPSTPCYKLYESIGEPPVAAPSISPITVVTEVSAYETKVGEVKGVWGTVCTILPESLGVDMVL